ncbi:hypothetical protein FHS43_002124 [Streptosporangium becharense]|uniref:DUF3103 domain-containing protein n=1 Tax=Streptosporangium becharense TaxID=1816182 RepID=A0A7W9MEJ6_9ACTN|nr:DUF3103 family protein [Streptosporangium becharense]MBB2910861.1 hypothetical protein [Streptosporangium becharense]MBB5817556.1 hypothetical protein [Streptosporangium becharense]
MKKTATIAALALATTLAGVAASPAAMAAPPQPSAADTSAADRAAAMDGYKRHLAEEVARRLGEQRFRDALIRELTGDGQADLVALLDSVPGAQDVAGYARNANDEILKLKGVQAEESLLQIRIDPKMAKRISAGETLVMATPSSEEKTVRTVAAFDVNGRSQELDAVKAPKRPVLVVGLDEQKSVELAQRFVRQRLTEAGVGGADRTGTEKPQTQPQSQQNEAGSLRPVQTLEVVRNINDHEPWYKGSPEIYAWVTGLGSDGKARVDQVWMPYIQKENATYYPHQTLIEWNNFTWTSLDVVFMEHDDNTDLSGLARAVVEAALAASGNGQYIPLADKIIAALPGDLTKDDDDYVDSYYNISAGSRGNVPSASIPPGMGISLEFKWV